MHHACDKMTRQSLVCVTMGGPSRARPLTNSSNRPANPKCGPAMTAADDYADSAMISAGHLAGPATDLTSDQFDSVAGSGGHSPGTTKRPAGHGAGSTSASARDPIGSAMEPAKHRYAPTDVVLHQCDTRYIYVIIDIICSVVTVLVYILCCLILCTTFREE